MPQPSPPVRVLVVDDEHLIADTLSKILQMRGFEVKTAYSGEQAVESAKVFGPDVLVTDVVMSGMNGIETGRCIQSMLPSCKVILFSGHVATTDLLRDYDDNTFEVMLKPVHPKVFVSRVFACSPHRQDKTAEHRVEEAVIDSLIRP